jgi:hypothetical protein
MLFSLIGFKTQTYTIICELICNIIFAATPCMQCGVRLAQRTWPRIETGFTAVPLLCTQNQSAMTQKQPLRSRTAPR